MKRRLTSAFAAAFGVVLWRWFKLSTVRLALTALATAAAALLLPAHPTLAVLVAVAGLAWCTAGQEGEAGEMFTQSWDNAKHPPAAHRRRARGRSVARSARP